MCKHTDVLVTAFVLAAASFSPDPAAVPGIRKRAVDDRLFRCIIALLCCIFPETPCPQDNKARFSAKKQPLFKNWQPIGVGAGASEPLANPATDASGKYVPRQLVLTQRSKACR